jgi:hypothetical protein
MQKQSTGSDSMAFVGSVNLEVGPSIAKLRLSAETWPAMTTMCGIILVFLGMLFLFPGKPQRYHRDGLSKIGYYIESVAKSHGEYASVIIAKPNGSYSVVVARRGHDLSVNIFSDLYLGEVSDVRSKIGDFFAKRGVMPMGLQTNDSGTKPSRYQFSLSGDPAANTHLVRSLFSDVFGAGDSTGLEFTTSGF